MSTLIHKTIMLALLKDGCMYSPDYGQRVDSLLDISHSFLLAHEEVVATLYAPQKPEAFYEAVGELASSLRQAKSELLEFRSILALALESQGISGLEKKMAAATISGGQSEPAKKEKDVRKWFETCFEQVAKLCQGVGKAHSVAS